MCDNDTFPTQRNRTAMQDFEWVKDAGLGGVLVFILFMLWRMGSWFGTNIVIPWRDRGMEHLDKVNSNMTAQTESLIQLNGRHDETHETVKEIHNHLMAG